MSNEEGTLIATGTSPNGKSVEVFLERGLAVVRDAGHPKGQQGDRLTHSDNLAGLEGAGFKLRSATQEPASTPPAGNPTGATAATPGATPPATGGQGDGPTAQGGATTPPAPETPKVNA